MTILKNLRLKKHKLHLDGGIYHNNKNKMIKKKNSKNKKIFFIHRIFSPMGWRKDVIKGNKIYKIPKF